MKPAPPDLLSKPAATLSRPPWLAIAAAFGFTAVAFGAMGAHALDAQLKLRDTRAVWETAVLYHGLHAVVLLALALAGEAAGGAGILFALGIVAFSGSLYALALAHLPWIGFVTPLGGFLLLAGWAVLFWRGVRK